MELGRCEVEPQEECLQSPCAKEGSSVPKMIGGTKSTMDPGSATDWEPWDSSSDEEPLPQVRLPISSPPVSSLSISQRLQEPTNSGGSACYPDDPEHHYRTACIRSWPFPNTPKLRSDAVWNPRAHGLPDEGPPKTAREDFSQHLCWGSQIQHRDCGVRPLGDFIVTFHQWLRGNRVRGAYCGLTFDEKASGDFQPLRRPPRWILQSRIKGRIVRQYGGPVSLTPHIIDMGLSRFARYLQLVDMVLAAEFPDFDLVGAFCVFRMGRDLYGEGLRVPHDTLQQEDMRFLDQCLERSATVFGASVAQFLSQLAPFLSLAVGTSICLCSFAFP